MLIRETSLIEPTFSQIPQDPDTHTRDPLSTDLNIEFFVPPYSPLTCIHLETSLKWDYNWRVLAILLATFHNISLSLP